MFLDESEFIEPFASTNLHQIALGPDGVVVAYVSSSTHQEGFDIVSEETAALVRDKVGRCRIVDGAFEAFAPVTFTDRLPAVSRRQFFQQLAIAEIVTRDEALAAVRTGDIPVAMQTIIDALPQDARFEAEMLVSGASTFEYNHPLVDAIRARLEWSQDRLNQFWSETSEL